MSFSITTSGNQLSSVRKTIFAMVSVSLIILICYSNTFKSSWHFDDAKFTDQKELQLTEFSANEILRVIGEGQIKFRRPVVVLTLALNYYFGNKSVFGYHLVNISIHITASIFLFLFIHNLLIGYSPSTRYKKNAYNIALISTTLWAVNPVHTQAITYIIQRMASLAGMFYIMSMYFYLKGRTNNSKNKQILFIILSVITFLLAMGSKENSILLPISLLCLELMVFKSISLSQFSFRKNRSLLLVFAGMALAFLFLFIFIQGGKPFAFLNGYAPRIFTLKERILTEPRVIIFYISLLFYPMPDRLCLNHDLSISQSLTNPPETLAAILIIAVIIAGCLFISKKHPIAAYAVIFFFLNHLVESTIVPLELVFEHRNYVPSMLIFIPATILMLKLVDVLNMRMKKLIIVSSIFVLIIIGHSTYVRNFVWRSEESLWLDCIAKYPDLWRPYNNLGKYYSDTNQIKKSIEAYKKSLNKKVLNNRLDQSYFITYYNLGNQYLKQNKFEKALGCFFKAEKINPRYAPLQNNIGLAFLKYGNIKEAKYRFEKALEYQPGLIQAKKNLSKTD